MTLSCSCDWGGPEPGECYWDGCSKQQPMPERKRRARCCSCKGFINTGDIAVEFYRYKCLDEDSIEGQINGDSKPMASWYECEECNDLRAALEDLGYCVYTTSTDIRNLRNGRAKSCGCLRHERLQNQVPDLTGQTFGQLTVINNSGQHRRRGVLN